MSDQLDADWHDRVALVTKLSASLVPIIGGPLAELVTEVVPRAVNRPDSAHLGSSMEEIDKEKLYDVGKQHLLSLGLLQHNYGHVKSGEYPPFDRQSGGFKSRIEISYLGRMLLKEAGIDLPV